MKFSMSEISQTRLQHKVIINQANLHPKIGENQSIARFDVKIHLLKF